MRKLVNGLPQLDAPAGAVTAPPRAWALQAGALEFTLDEQGRLGPVRLEGQEVWHGVHWLLRDHHWRTPPVRLGRPRWQRSQDAAEYWSAHFRGVFEPYAPANQALGQLPVHTALRVQATAPGVITVTGEAWLDAAAPPLAVNRIGLCVLHPLWQAGARLEVLHDDGRTTRSALPRRVSPWPPFSGIRELRIALRPGCWAVATFEGDSFELEDQRNNADASFKAYARSNFLPRPFVLEPGAGPLARVRQCVRLAVERTVSTRGSAARLRPEGRQPPVDARPKKTELVWSELRVDAPRPFHLGLALDETVWRAPARAAAQAERLAPDVLHLTMDARCPPTPRQFEALAQVLAASGARLRVDLHDLADARAALALPGLARCMERAGLKPWAVAVFPTSRAQVQRVREAFPSAQVGGGTPDFFVQLNRMDRLPELDFATFTVCPTVHQADDPTVMQSALALPGMLQTLAERYPGLPVYIGPSRIAARRSPLGELAPTLEGRPCPLSGSDPRESLPFAAAWVVAQAAAALAHGAQGCTVQRWCDVAGKGWWPGSSDVAEHERLRARAPWPANPLPGGLAAGLSGGGQRSWQALGLGRLQVLGWRWQTAAGMQDWLVRLGAQPLPVRLPASGVTARYLAADGCWQPMARASRRTAWPWPPATVLVVEHAAA